MRLARLAPLALVLACSRPADRPAGAGLPDAFALLPADASLLAHVDLRALRASPLWDKNRGVLEADPDARRTLDALAACGVPFTGMDALDLAVSADGRDVAAVLTGDGVGDPAHATCLQGQLPERKLRLEPGDAPVLALDGARARFHGPRTLVFATPGYERPVEALRAGPPAAPGPLHTLAAGVAPGRSIWFVGQVPDKTARTLAPALSGLQQVRGALDLREGLGVELDLRMDGEPRATAVHDELRRQFDALKSAGLPPGVIDRVDLRRDGADVHVGVGLTMAEISAVQALAAALASPTDAGPVPP